MAERQRQQRAAAESRRLATVEREWSTYKAQVTQAQREQQRELYFQDYQKLIDDLARTVTPPPQPEPEITFIEIDKSGESEWGRLPELPRLPLWR
jgi:hypothetical protein